MAILLPIAAALGLGYFLYTHRTTTTFTGKSGHKWQLKRLTKAPSLLGMRQLFEVSDDANKVPVLQFMSVVTNTSYLPIVAANGTLESPTAVAAINDLGLTVMPAKPQNSDTQTVNGTTYKLDLLGAMPDGRFLMDIFKDGVHLMRVAQVNTDAATRRIVDTNATSLTPDLVKAMQDFGVPQTL